MKKIIILGCPGSGKSTFARALHNCTGLPLIHLDSIWWKPDRTHITRPAFDEKLAAVIAADAWIIDGDYSRTYAVRLQACDTVFFLDYSEEECMAGIRERIGAPHPDLPWTEDALDPALVQEVHKYRNENRPVVLKWLSAHPEKKPYIFHARDEADRFLAAYADKKHILRRNSMQNKALVVIDIQNDITKNYKEIISNINAAIDFAVKSDMPVVYIKHNNLSDGTRTFKPGTHGEELVPDMKVVSDNIFTKSKGNALTCAAFADFIRENAIRDFYIAGADAVACVKSTCYNMAKAGYGVTVLSDCITSYDKRKIAEMLAYYESKGCKIALLQDWLAEG